MIKERQVRKMDLLSCPKPEIWDRRQAWCRAIGEDLEVGAYFVSDQACALSMDVEASFCAGAWVAVIFLAMAVIDTQLRETEVSGFAGNTKDLIEVVGANPNLQTLRKRRNALVHIDPGTPALTVDQQWANRAELEAEAKQAYRLMMETIYMSPWT